MEGWDRRATTSRAWCWSRSLLAVYDFEDLVRLDVPWWTFDAADRVEAFLRGRRDARVFEWGSGASTMWLASRAGSVTAVEHDAEWAHMVGDRVPANARVVLVPPAPVAGNAAPILSEKAGFEGLDFTDYVEQIDKEDDPFDLIVVDGRARGACLRRALDHLAPGGMIVFDNVDRERYRRAIAAEGAGIRVDWTRGLTPCLPYPTRTALITVAES
ncbi:MAG: class I SAM-dependent methyltransferase [Actinomycetales bacterium]|nr:class I SAM-dependent methyltransferase [Actinomycetales bacterium]